MLRVVLLLLLVLNGAFFAWIQGWFGSFMPAPGEGEREPQRLQAQVNPERVSVLGPGAASSPATFARRLATAAVDGPVCMEAGPFAQGDIAAAETAMARANFPAGSWARASTGGPIWLVFGGRYTDPAQRALRAAEFKRLEVEFELVDAPAELAPGFILSRHANRSAAEAAMANQMTKSPTVLRDLRLLAMPVPAGAVWIRLPEAEPKTRSQLNSIGAVNKALAGGFRPCAD